MPTDRIALTFARGTQPWGPQATTTDVGSGTIAQNLPYDDLATIFDWSWSGPLPDIVLAPQSTVVFLVGYGGGSNPALTVAPTVVTLSQQTVADTVQTPTVTDIAPLFTPLPVSET